MTASGEKQNILELWKFSISWWYILLYRCICIYFCQNSFHFTQCQWILLHVHFTSTEKNERSISQSRPTQAGWNLYSMSFHFGVQADRIDAMWNTASFWAKKIYSKFFVTLKGNSMKIKHIIWVHILLSVLGRILSFLHQDFQI